MTFPAKALSVDMFKLRLAGLAKFLAKAQAHCAGRKIDPAAMLGMRLFPDMFTLARQVQLTTDFAKGPAARLAGMEVPSYPDVETTFEQLQERIARTIAFLDSIPAAAFEGAEARMIEIKVGGQPMSFRGDDYLVNFATPNFYFHLVTAYALLRHGGVEIGKRDFMGAA